MTIRKSVSLPISQEFESVKCEECQREFLVFAVLRRKDYDDECLNFWNISKLSFCPNCGKQMREVKDEG